MRKSILLSLAVVGFLAASIQTASACPKGSKPCPFMVYENAKELGLSEKQKSQVKKIKQNFKNDVDALAKKYGNETDAVLTAEQKQKYSDLKASGHCSHGGKHKHKEGAKEGDSCPMQK